MKSAPKQVGEGPGLKASLTTQKAGLGQTEQPDTRYPNEKCRVVGAVPLVLRILFYGNIEQDRFGKRQTSCFSLLSSQKGPLITTLMATPTPDSAEQVKVKRTGKAAGAARARPRKRS
ncbi:hypothetical protein [Hymenobacter volaticus]|uniref:Uncharacterized protein n=1 Tax=Hymenobacter volaticus TaxID=2932254 RepID=A0ABY4GE14_9BACT|nr:hypothetical protein [Hymenobacter volaticus]UOQ69163.1 hypothetical protein MUN86_25965 [Hymenobacter volaticus]